MDNIYTVSDRHLDTELVCVLITGCSLELECHTVCSVWYWQSTIARTIIRVKMHGMRDRMECPRKNAITRFFVELFPTVSCGNVLQTLGDSILVTGCATNHDEIRILDH